MRIYNHWDQENPETTLRDSQRISILQDRKPHQDKVVLMSSL